MSNRMASSKESTAFVFYEVILRQLLIACHVCRRYFV